MRRLLSHIGLKDIEKCQYHVAFLGNARDNVSGDYISKYQISHRDFIPEEMEKSGNNWYIFYTSEKSGMILNVQGSQPNQIFLYTVSFKKAICIHTNTVHSGGYCTDSKERSLRMQIHVSSYITYSSDSMQL